MKEDYRDALRKTLCNWMGRTRYALNLTQDKMAEVLLIDVRSYSDIDRGISLCSTLTLVLFLVYLCPEPVALLNDIQVAFENVRQSSTLS